MKHFIWMILLLVFPVALSAQTMADTSQAMVDSIVANRPALKAGYQVTVLKSSAFRRFLTDGQLIPTADSWYVLLDVPLSTATGTKLDSLNTFMTGCRASGGMDVYMQDGTAIAGRLYIRRDRAVAYLKSLVP